MKNYETVRGNSHRNHRRNESTPQASSTSKDSRKKRVNVTPTDWDQLEAMAEKLGLPYSKVYNMAFSLLQDKFGE